MTEHIDKLQKRKDELIDEQMDKTWTSIYSQWDKRNPNAENYRKTIFASGREVTTQILVTSGIHNTRSEWNHVKYKEPMRRWVFRKIFNRGDE